MIITSETIHWAAKACMPSDKSEIYVDPEGLTLVQTKAQTILRSFFNRTWITGELAFPMQLEYITGYCGNDFEEVKKELWLRGIDFVQVTHVETLVNDRFWGSALVQKRNIDFLILIAREHPGERKEEDYVSTPIPRVTLE